MYLQTSIPFPDLRGCLDVFNRTFAERALALLIIASLLLQPVASLLVDLAQSAPAAAFQRQASTPVQVDLAQAPASSPAPVLPPAYALPAELAGKAEIPLLRTEHSATFDMGNGTFAILQDMAPLHYADAEGQWQPIDPTFTANALGWINSTNSLRTFVDRSTSSARLGGADVGLSWTPAALLLAGERGDLAAIAHPQADRGAGLQSGDGRAVRYTNSWSLDGVEDQWQSGAGQVEYSMRLASLPDRPWWRQTPASLDLQVMLTLQPGASFIIDGEPARLPLETDAALVLRGQDGGEMILQPPVAFEQAQMDQRVQGTYLLAHGTTPGTVELRVRIPWSWLAAPERTFPVIIDPLFQMRAASQMMTARYNPSNLEFIGLQTGAPYLLGRSQDAANRLLMRFNVPQLPNGAAITKATLLAKAGDLINLSYWQLNALLSPLRLYPIANGSGPWSADGGEPSFDEGALVPPGPQTMGYQPRATFTGLRWDVTSLVQGWRPPNVDGGFIVNHGLLLKADFEACPPHSAASIHITCGAFVFQNQANNWPLSELEFTQQGSADPLDIEKTETSGVRLIVQYTAAALVEGQPVTMNYVGGSNVPPGVDPYYKVSHAYTLPAIPNYWQAVVARSFGPTVGQNPPPVEGQTFRRPLQGGLPLSIRTPSSANSESFVEWRRTTPTAGRTSYVLINGRGDTNINPATIQAVVGGNTDEPQPTGYEIRLQKELGTLSTNTATFAQTGRESITVPYVFNSHDPLALWNLNLPPGSNTEFRVTVASDTSSSNDYMALANGFSAGIVNSDGKLDFPNVYGEGADGFMPLERETLQSPFLGKDERPRVLSQMVTPGAGQNALVLTYDGPAITLNDFEIPTAASADAPTGDIGPVGFRVNIEITSCAAGSYPDGAGGCLRVECPTSSFAAANIVTVGGVRLWNAAGWNKAGTTGTSIYGVSAPMIGPTNGPPTLMVIGSISYNTAPEPDTITTTKAKAILVRCPTPGPNTTAPLDEFPVSQGTLKRETVANQAALTFSSNFGYTIYNNPWSMDDRIDIVQSFHLYPAAGKAVGSGLLNRFTGAGGGDPRLLRFDTAWSWTAGGWPTLAVETLAPRNDNPAPAPIASIDLNLGNQFELDITPANGDSYRQFKALRARVATLTQPQSMGGASRHVQAVILPRNAYVPTTPAVSCWRSCIDLRGPTDSATRLDRVWEMPDVHVGLAANMLLMRSQGVMQVYSTDHPRATAGFSEEYSFDAYKASVTVEEDYCTAQDQELGNPKVLVIRGETRMALPNIGSTNDPNAALSASFKLCETALRNVHMSFKSPVGLPLGSSGLFLTGLDGTVDISPTNTRITLGLDFQAAPGGDGGIFKVRGEVIIDTLGLFEFQGHGTVLGAVDVDGRIWVAWNPLDTGFEINISVGKWLDGFARAHLWVGQGFGNKYTWLPDNDEKHFAGEIGATLTIPEGIILDWGLLVLPPTDISISVEVAFGEFCTNNSCTRYEWGIKGKFVVLGYDVGIYYGFDKGLDFILGNDDHILIDEYGGALVTVASGDRVQVLTGPAKVNGAVDIPLTVKATTEQILVGVGWQAGSPQLSLIDPDGVVIQPVNAGPVQAHVDADSAIMTVQSPKPGVWIARIDNLSESGIEHYKFAYLANEGAPGTPANRGRILQPDTADEDGTNGYTITWETPDDATDAARISLFYSRTAPNSEVITGAIGIDVPIVQNLPFKTGSFTWDTSGLANGSYTIKAVVDDGINELPLEAISRPDNVCLPMVSGLPPARAFAADRFPGTVVMTAAGTIRLNDLTPPATPTGLQVSAAQGALVAQWTALPDNSDATHYLLRWGPRNAGNPAIFDVENQALVTAGTEPMLRLGAVKVDIPYGVDISAVDASGNASAQSAPVFATASGQGEPVPFPPPGFVITGVTATTASFEWSQPFGPVPAGYRLTYTKSGVQPEVKTLDVTTTSATLSELATGAAYDVALTSFNSEGWQSTVVSPTLRIVLSNGVDGNGDGLPDDWAAANGVAGSAIDSDGDGVTNGEEFGMGTNPMSQDSDGDGMSDGEEQSDGTDALDSGEFGVSPSQPRLLLLDNRLSFKAKKQPGGEAAPQSIDWLNIGGGNLVLAATPDDAWVQATVTDNTVQIGVDHSGLTPGFHSSVVRLAAMAGSDPLIGEETCIQVNAWVLRADDDVPPPMGHLYAPAVYR